MDPKTRALRLVAIVGAAVVLVQELWGSFPLAPRQGAAFIVLVVALVVVPLAMALCMRNGLRRVLESPDLLVPPLMLIFALGVLGWVARIPLVAAVLTPSVSQTILGISFSLSVMLILTIVVYTVHAAWMTTLVLRVVREGDADPVRALPGIRRWFWRVLGLCIICYVALFAGLAVGMGLAALALPLALVFMGALALALNAATAALLPVALDDRLSFGEALSRGVQSSLSGMRRWILPLLVQLELLGLVTFVSVWYSDATSYHTNTNFKINAFWVGGYESDSRWYGAVMGALEAPKVECVTTLLQLLFLVLAVAMKITIVERLERDAHAPPEADANPHTAPEPEAEAGAEIQNGERGGDG